MLKFKIEQIAICPPDPEKARKLLEEMGAEKWSQDLVVASGEVDGEKGKTNVAELQFNYDLISGNEFEILHYKAGDNWMDEWSDSVSHFGMHCSNDELISWRRFFKERNIKVAQEVLTESHTNPAIAGKRKYNYVIFNTRQILGVDLKFIVRIDLDVKPMEDDDLPF